MWGSGRQAYRSLIEGKLLFGNNQKKTSMSIVWNHIALEIMVRSGQDPIHSSYIIKSALQWETSSALQTSVCVSCELDQ